ncbi:hypothetical protein PRUPE_1G165600 [Prunus persica]|uniref:Uncharacterized protein n=1 Tax=Prunus persica TaxID=3760 RepID=A0A251QYF3_PRUPE|nr:hypothetical protein PRUPE_1G165600 [Prunus persica]
MRIRSLGLPFQLQIFTYMFSAFYHEPKIYLYVDHVVYVTIWSCPFVKGKVQRREKMMMMMMRVGSIYE